MADVIGPDGLPLPGASGILNPNAGVGFFLGNTGPMSLEEIKRRRAVAAAQASQKRPFPKNIGEGLTSLGEAFGDRMTDNRLTAAEQAYKTGRNADPVFGAQPGAAAPGARSGVVDPMTQRNNIAALLTPGGGQGNPTEAGVTPPTTDTLEPPTSTAGGPSDDPAWSARANAIGGIESGGRYDSVSKAPTKYGHALGKYGVVEANVAPWTQAALGQPLTPQQFLANPQAQDAVFKHRFGQYVDKFGEEGAARAWFGGPGNVNNTNATDAYQRLNVGQYGQDYLRRLQGAQRGASTASDAPGVPGEGAPASAIEAGSDTDANPPTPTGIQPMRVAQAGSMAVPGVLDPRTPEKPIPPSGIRPIDPSLQSNVEPVAPKRQETLTPDEVRGWQIMRKYYGDEEAQGVAKMLMERGAKQREDAYNRQVEEYKVKYDLFKARTLAEAQREYERPEMEQKLAEAKRLQQQAIADARDYPFGKAKALELSKESYAKVEAIPAAATAIKGIRQVLDSDAGMFTGGDANIKLSLSKWANALGLPYNPKLENTQVFQSLVTPILAALRPAIVGAGAQSLPEFQLLQDAAGGKITLERGSIERILGAIEKLNHVAAVDHHKKLYANATDENGRQVLFGNYQLPMDQLVPAGKVNKLRSEIAKHGNDQAAIAAEMDAFNKDNYTDGLAQRLLGR